MKKTLTTLFIALFAVTFMYSCKKDSLTDSLIKSNIVGTWKGYYDAGTGVKLNSSDKFENGEQTITFNKDMTYSIKRGGDVYITDGTYSINNANIYFSQDSTYMQVDKISDKKMVLEEIDNGSTKKHGNKYRYKKQ